MTIRDNEGLKNDLELVYAQKSGGIYHAELDDKIKLGVFRATIGLSLSARTVFYCYHAHTGYTYPARLSGREIAEMCGIHVETFYKAKKELLEKGMIYRIPKHRATDPDRIYVSDIDFDGNVVDGKTVDGKFPLSEKTVNDLDAAFTDEGNDVQAKVLKTSIIKYPPKVLEDSYKSSSFQKESDVSVGMTVTREELDLAFADPLPLDDPVLECPDEEALSLLKKLVGNLKAGQGKAFKLTPSNQKKPEKRGLLKPHPRKPVPPQLLDMMLAFCFGIETTQQWVTVDKVMIGRASGAITKLSGAGADLTQLRGFIEKWRGMGWMHNPSPEMVVRNWFKVMGEPTPKIIAQAGGTVITREDKEAEETQRRIDAYLQQRARERNQ